MKIKEVSQRTGLTRKTIRFYEAQGLFTSERSWQNGREYHEYSEENVWALTRIAALRRARFTVDEIRRMQADPEQTRDIFYSYRERLREEATDLNRILTLADSIDVEALSGPEDLVLRMGAVTAELPLPAVDVHPRFRYLDELEASVSRRRRLSMTEQEDVQHKLAAKNATVYAGFGTQNQSTNSVAGGYGSGFDISSSQKIAAYNLLVNSREE